MSGGTVRTSSGVRHPIRYNLQADHAKAELAAAFADTYLDTIIEAIVNHPRSQQVEIGPSELGIDCMRALAHKLNEDPEPARPGVPWKPTIGTATHKWLDEDAFTPAAAPNGPEPYRWITERRVTVGTIGGRPVTGSCDLWDSFGRIVGDHKVVGNYTLREYRSHGPSQQYRKQAHLYGKGWEAEGLTPELVAICFLPREGELTDTFIWTEPYSRQVAEETLDRANRLHTAIQLLGIDAVVNSYPPCFDPATNTGDRWCSWCGPGSIFTPKQRPAANSTADLFQ